MQSTLVAALFMPPILVRLAKC